MTVCAKAELIELAVEDAWDRLLRSAEPRTIYLTRGGQLAWGEKAAELHKAGASLWLVGTYSRDVSLADFREDVFWRWDQGGRGG